MTEPAQYADTVVVRYEELARCSWCGAHLIGDRVPVSITKIGDTEPTYIAGDWHICRGGCPLHTDGDVRP